MYHAGVRARKQHKYLFRFVWAVILIGIGFGSYLALHIVTKPESSITNAAGTSLHYDPAKDNKTYIDEKLFTMRLPVGWKPGTAPGDVTVTAPYYYRSPTNDARQVGIYIDQLPTTLGVNRVVIVAAQGASLSHENISDNCAGFAQASASDQTSRAVPAKWLGIPFLCDVGDSKRNLVGTVSRQGINSVTLTGKTIGTHTVFITYTDNSASPDFSVFYAILDSFSLK